MRTVAAFFDKPGFEEYPFSIELYRIVYRQLAEEIRERGGCLYIVRGAQTYWGQNTFAHAWKYDSGEWVHVEGPVTLDVVWNKGLLRSDRGCAVVNDPDLDDLATDKWKTYQLFPKLHAKSTLVHSMEEWKTALRSVRTAKAVVKPVDGWGGEGILVHPPSELASHVFDEFPCIVQEFVDTSGGIPGIVEGMHDLRMILFNGEITLSYIRTTPPGEFTANVSRGGKEIEVPLNDIPAEARQVAVQIDAALSRFQNRLYTVDVGLDRDGTWKLFEINTKPGFSPKETGPSYATFYGRLADFLLQSVALS